MKITALVNTILETEIAENKLGALRQRIKRILREAEAENSLTIGILEVDGELYEIREDWDTSENPIKYIGTLNYSATEAERDQQINHKDKDQ